MKKTIISTLKVTAVAAIMASCNNAEEAKKLAEADAQAIQTAVDAQLTGLQEGVNAECTVLVDSIATEQYNAWVAAEGKKTGAKPKPKPKPEEPKKEATVGDGKPKMGNKDEGTVGDGKPKMGNTDEKTIGTGKPKMGGN